MESKLSIYFNNKSERHFSSEAWGWVFHHHAIELKRKDGRVQVIIPEYNILYYEVSAE